MRQGYLQPQLHGSGKGRGKISFATFFKSAELKRLWRMQRWGADRLGPQCEHIDPVLEVYYPKRIP